MEGAIGTEIAGYRIESEIGRGGMGVVYLATQAFPERRVALKLLSPELAADPAFRERFVRESNAAASTEHPNIVPVYGAGESDGQLYLAMRYVEGTDLRTLLARDAPLSPERAARICAEVAEALEAAHERGLVHRDVKPGNVLLDGRERAYLSDFGLIRRTRIDTEITRTGQFMGTVDYVAPEQIKGGELDGRADVYSLGCVLYECLTGAAPFRRDSEVATMYAQLEEPVPAPSSKRPGVPRTLDQVVARATAKRPDDRFATAGEMAEALRGGVSRPDGAWSQRFRRRIAVAVAGLALIVATVVFVALRVRDDGSTAAPSASPSAVPPPLNSLVRVDGESGETLTTLAAALPAGAFFPRVEVGEGGIWVLGSDSVARVDPSIVEVVDTITVLGGESMAVGYRTVWVGAPPGVVRIDPIDNDRLRPVRLNQPGAFSGSQVGVGASRAWAVTPDGELTRIDPATGQRLGTVDTGQTASGIGVGFGGVWIIDKLQGTLVRVDPATLEVGEPVRFPGELDDISVGAGGVWLLDQTAGVVTRYDPVSETVGSPIRVGLEPTDLATGSDAVWVANHGDGTISKIDPVTGRTQTIPIGAPVAAIAVEASSGILWVTIAQLGSG
ncbi:MAG: protein kinase [Actinobacteria bacterium]|nr:protein kinase [Actinomycetota bacterium]